MIIVTTKNPEKTLLLKEIKERLLQGRFLYDRLIGTHRRNCLKKWSSGSLLSSLSRDDLGFIFMLLVGEVFQCYKFRLEFMMSIALWITLCGVSRYMEFRSGMRIMEVSHQNFEVKFWRAGSSLLPIGSLCMDFLGYNVDCSYGNGATE